MAGVCILINEDAQIITAIGGLEDLLNEFIGTFGDQCSILSMVTSLIGSDVLDQIESAIKRITDGISDIIYRIAEFVGLDTDARAIILAYIANAIAIYNTVIIAVNSAIASLASLLKQAIDALRTSNCTVLRQAVSGAAIAILTGNPALAISSAINAVNPLDFLGSVLNGIGVTGVLQSILTAVNQLDAIPAFPDLTPYVCITF